MPSLFSPLYLAAAAAALAALVVVHLLLRARPFLHLFPATRFVITAAAARRSHRRLLRRLLLLLRALALAALGLLFARPFIVSPEPLTVGTHAVIVLDTSYSMNLPVDGPFPSRRDRLLRWLRERLGELERPAVTLVTGRGDRIGAIAMDRGDLRGVLAEAAARPGYSSSGLGGGLSRAVRLANRTPARNRLLLIVSDFTGPALAGWPASRLDPGVEVVVPDLEFPRPLFIESIEALERPGGPPGEIGIRVTVAGDFSRDGPPAVRIGSEGRLLRGEIPAVPGAVEIYEIVEGEGELPVPVMAGWEREDLRGRNLYGVVPARPRLEAVFSAGGEGSPRLLAAVRAVAAVSDRIGLDSGQGAGYRILEPGSPAPDPEPGETVLVSGWGAELADLRFERRLPIDLYRYQEGNFPTGEPLRAEAAGRWLLAPHPGTGVPARYADGVPLLLEWEEAGARWLLWNFSPESAGPAGWVHQPEFPIAVRHLLVRGRLEETPPALVTAAEGGEGEPAGLWGDPPPGPGPGIGEAGGEYIVRNLDRRQFVPSDREELRRNLARLKRAEGEIGEEVRERKEIWPPILAFLLVFCLLLEIIGGARYGG